jgi:hypothetical protein
MPESDWRPSSLAAQGLGWVDSETGAISPPIHMSSTYQRDADNRYGTGRIYIRDENPSFDQAQALLTRLEGGRAALLFASGMAAATATFMALKPGDHVVVPVGMYWALRNWLKTFAEPWGLAVDAIDMTDLNALRRALRPGGRAWSGSRHRPTRCGRSPISPASPSSPTRPAPRSRRIPRWRLRSSAVRSNSARTSSCIRRPSISMAIPTSAPAR